MRTPFPRCLVLLLALAGPAAADPAKLDGISAERTVEAMSSMIVLPASVNGTLSYQLYPSCATVTLSATPTTRYEINHKPVPLATLTKLFATGRRYPALVAWKLNAPVLLRLEVYAADAAFRSTSP